MKKLLLLLAMLILTGCSAKPLESKYSFKESDEWYTYEEIVTLEGNGNSKLQVMNKMTTEVVVEFLDEETFKEDIELWTMDYEGQRSCPNGDENGEQCSPYVTFEYEVIDNKVTAKEVIDYAKARKNKEEISYDIEYNEGEYYAYDIFIDELLEEGYTEL